MVHCIIAGCKSNSRNKSLSFHQIPTKDPNREEWLKILSIHGRRKGIPNQYAVICGLHFRAEDFKPNKKLRILKLNAVPSIFSSRVKQEPADFQTEEQAVTNNLLNANITSPQRTKCSNLFDLPTINEEIETKPFVHISNFHSLTLSQNNEKVNDCLNCSKELKSLRNKIKYQTSVISKTKQELRHVKNLYRALNENVKHLSHTLKDYNLKTIATDASMGDAKAIFLLDQLKAMKNEKSSWAKITIRFYMMWLSQSPSSYKYVRNLNMLTMPSETTLRKYFDSEMSKKGLNNAMKKILD